jgi:hypothetical protein
MRVVAEDVEAVLDHGEAFAAFDGVVEVDVGENEGSDREEREYGDGEEAPHGCVCV